MKLVNYKTTAKREQLLSLIKDSNRVNEKVKFDDKLGRPQMFVKERKNSITVTCRYVGGSSRDDGFIIGTFFWGRLTEKKGETHLSGIILTAPLFYTAIFGLLVYSIVAGVINTMINGAFTFNPIAIIIAIFSYIMFRQEFKKQGIIARYLYRAIRISELE